MNDVIKYLNNLEEIVILKDILEETGIDFETAIRMFLKKIIREGNILFLFNNIENEIVASEKLPIFKRRDVVLNRMTKSIARSLFIKEGEQLKRNDTISFASKNKTTNVYWSNPLFEYLDDEWHLILHDNINRKLFLFYIPAGSIDNNALEKRADSNDKIDLQIMYGDPTFTDTRSGYSFLKFYKRSIDY